MNGICRALGCGVPCTLAGSTYLLSPLTLGAIGVCEQLLLSRRQTPMDIAARICDRVRDSKAKAAAIARARLDMRRDRTTNRVKHETMMAWIDSDEGTVLTAWLCLRKEHPARFELLEQAAAVIEKATEAEKKRFRELRDQVSGMHWFSLVEWQGKESARGRPEDGRDRDDEEESPSKRVPTWRQWVQTIQDEFGYPLSEIREWTMDNAKAALAPRKKTKKGKRERDDDGGDGEGDNGSGARLNRKLRRERA